VARDPYCIAWGAVTYLSLIDGWKYIPNVVHISGQHTLSRSPAAISSRSPGTIKHAQLAAIKHNREVIARYRARSDVGCKSLLPLLLSILANRKDAQRIRTSNHHVASALQVSRHSSQDSKAQPPYGSQEVEQYRSKGGKSPPIRESDQQHRPETQSSPTTPSPSRQGYQNSSSTVAYPSSSSRRNTQERTPP
jgi:hypothetical protein